MSIAMSVLRDRVRSLLRDKTTRPDATAITPFWSNAEVLNAMNAAVTNRQGLIGTVDPRFYLTTKTYVGITDAIASTSNEQYKLPGCESDSSAVIRQWVVLRRSDLDTMPAVRFIEPDIQDPVNAGDGLFDGLYSAYPENLYSSTETVALISSTRFRIKPDPATTSYTYKLWYVKKATAMSADADLADIPDSWTEVIAYDSAIELKSTVNAASVGALLSVRNQLLQDLMGDRHGRNAGRAVFNGVRM